MLHTPPLIVEQSSAKVTLRTGPLAIYVAAWITAGLLAWVAFAVVTDGTTAYRLRHAYWFASIMLFAGFGLLFSQLLTARLELDDLQVRLLVWVIGWGVAAVAGWYLHVLVGGPFTGFVVLATLLTSQHQKRSRLVIVGLSLLVAGRAVMNLSEKLLVAGSVTVITVAAVAALTSRYWASRASALFVFSLVAWWGMAWVLAFWIPQAIGFPKWGGYGRTSLEVVIAFALGGASMAWQTPSGLARVTSSWALGGAAASIVGIGIDLAFRVGASFVARDPIGLNQRFLDVGHCIGMPVGALIALALVWRHAR